MSNTIDYYFMLWIKWCLHPIIATEECLTMRTFVVLHRLVSILYHSYYWFYISFDLIYSSVILSLGKRKLLINLVSNKVEQAGLSNTTEYQFWGGNWFSDVFNLL